MKKLAGTLEKDLIYRPGAKEGREEIEETGLPDAETIAAHYAAEGAEEGRKEREPEGNGLEEEEKCGTEETEIPKEVAEDAKERSEEEILAEILDRIPDGEEAGQYEDDVDDYF